MQVTVLGASGKVGRLVVDLLLKRGYSVRAMVHSHNNFASHPQLTVVTGDVHSKTDILDAIKDSDVVISTLGSWHTKTKDIVSSAIKHTIPAMEARGIKRIITLTGSGALARGDSPSPVARVAHDAFGIIAGKVITDSEEHIRLLESSQLDWTVIRSPVMRGFGQNSDYHPSTSPPSAWHIVHRQNVAECIVDQIDDTTWIRSAPYLSPSNK